VKAKADGIPAVFTISLNGQTKELRLIETGWKDVSLEKIKFSVGVNNLNAKVVIGTVCFDCFYFEE